MEFDHGGCKRLLTIYFWFRLIIWHTFYEGEKENYLNCIVLGEEVVLKSLLQMVV